MPRVVESRADESALVDRLLDPFRRFARTSASGGIVLLIATAAAILWANSRWADAYHALWEAEVVIGLSANVFHTTFRHLINDGLMTLFFFVVGLEIKREVLAGELSSGRSAALPMVAALGGMIVPAATYLTLNLGQESVHGWGVPMATDIAFSLGVLALLGDRIPHGLRVFVAALAIVDDLGAILVIALFYSSHIAWGQLAVAGLMLGTALAANLTGVRHAVAYALLGLGLWVAVLASGIHGTLAGVLLALVVPVRTRLDEHAFLGRAGEALENFRRAAEDTSDDPDAKALCDARHHTAIHELKALCEGAQPPLVRFEHALAGMVAFAILPLFAFANAGITLRGLSLSALGSPVTFGVAAGLLLGKPIGIVGFSWLAERSGLAARPTGVTWRLMAGAGMLCGIGFTMALFIAGLAFGEGAMLESAKLGVMGASLAAGVAGWVVLSGAPSASSDVPPSE
ncbi:MAG: Na+/H+ antiporter NhaA [Vicinamibacterales bacterium]